MKKIIIKIVAILIIGGILCTTDLSLRTAVFFVSPHSAATMEYEHYKTESKWCELYKITKNPPYEDETDGDLVIWAVYRIGPLHYSKYFGWE
jgi:hypothetical protein